MLHTCSTFDLRFSYSLGTVWHDFVSKLVLKKIVYVRGALENLYLANSQTQTLQNEFAVLKQVLAAVFILKGSVWWSDGSPEVRSGMVQLSIFPRGTKCPDFPIFALFQFSSKFESVLGSVKTYIFIYSPYGQKFQPVSGTDDLAAKRIEKLNDSEKKSC